jgi:5-methylcytosine-specific restriction endonuclease McrA
LSRKKLSKELEDKLDAAFRYYIYARDNDTCQRCGTEELTGVSRQCSHLIPRGWKIGRWEPLNAVTMCPGCHRLGKESWHLSPAHGMEWLKSYSDEMYNWVMGNKFKTRKWELNELEELLKELE